eukprot:83136-Amorphochlora_amoeboformis.AAC.1
MAPTLLIAVLLCHGQADAWLFGGGEAAKEEKRSVIREVFIVSSVGFSECIGYEECSREEIGIRRVEVDGSFEKMSIF